MAESPLVVLRQEEVAAIVRDAVRADRVNLMDELRTMLVGAATAAPASRPAQTAQQLLTTAQMAHALGVSRSVFFRRLRQHPQLKTLRRGTHWPEDATRAAFAALT